MEKVKLVVRPVRPLPEHLARKPHFSIVFGGHTVSPSVFKGEFRVESLEEFTKEPDCD